MGLSPNFAEKFEKIKNFSYIACMILLEPIKTFRKAKKLTPEEDCYCIVQSETTDSFYCIAIFKNGIWTKEFFPVEDTYIFNPEFMGLLERYKTLSESSKQMQMVVAFGFINDILNYLKKSAWTNTDV